MLPKRLDTAKQMRGRSKIILKDFREKEEKQLLSRGRIFSGFKAAVNKRSNK